MRKLMVSAFAAAFAMAFSAFAGTQVNWFNGGVAADWPNDASMDGGAWSAVTAAAPADLVAGFTDEKGLELDAGDDQLQFTAETARTLGTGTDSVAVTSEMQLYPFAEVPEAVEEGAKAGVILVSTDGGANVYGIRKTDGADANEWFLLSDDVVDPEEMATITIMAAPGDDDGTISVTYNVVIGGIEVAPAAVAVKAANTISKASYTGSGFLKSLSSTAIAATKTFTIADLSASGVQATVKSGATWDADNQNYVVAYGNTVVITYVAAAGYVMDPVDKEMAYADVANITAKPADVEPQKGKAHIQGGAYYLTLNAALDAATKGDTVVMDESQEGAGYAFAASRFGTGDNEGITINYGGYTYTFTDGKGTDDYRAFYIQKGNKVTFRNGTWKGSAGFVSRATNPMSAFAFVYCEAATFENIAMDASNFTASDASALTVLNGNVAVTGSTSITAPTGDAVTGFKSIRTGDYANDSSYTGGAVTLNTTGTLEGDMWFFGGSVTKTAAIIPSDTKYFWGRVVDSAFAPEQVATFGFAAMSGTMPVEKPANGVYAIGGQLYFTVSAALADETYSPATALADLTADVAIAAGKKLVMGAYSVDTAKITLAVGATVESVNQIALTSFTEVSGYTVKETPIVVEEQTVGYSYALEAVPQGTTFTIASATGCEVSVKIDNVDATAPYVAQVGQVVAFTLTPTGALEVPSFSGEFGNETLVNANFTAGGTYSYTVAQDAASEIACSFKVIDAKTNTDVKPIDVVPAGTDPANVTVAAEKIAALATKDAAVNVALTQKIAGWIKAKSIPGNTIASIGGDGAPTAEQFEEAFLLGTAIDAKEIADAKAAFKFPAITPGETPVVGGTANFNGTVTVQGSDDLKTWGEADGKKFFKATLTK